MLRKLLRICAGVTVAIFLLNCRRSYLLTRDAFGFDDEEDDGPAMLMDGGIVDSNDSSSRQTPGITAGGFFLHQLSAKAPGCEGFCCNMGDKEVQCLDVESCAAIGSNGSNAALPRPRYALVLSHYGVPTNRLLQSIKSMRAAALAAGADILVLMMQDHADQMSYRLQRRLKKWRVKVHLVPWALPPGMIYIKKVTKYDGWCGKMDFIRLHALALEGYDAIAYYDADCEFQGDILPVLQCASQGYFLSTSGGVGENLNVGFFATRPDRRLLEAALIFARRNNFSREDGWGHSGWKPRGYYYVGGECGQGFFYSLYYSRSEAAKKALEAAGIWQNGVFEPAQLDRCLWNYQTSWGCRKDFDCERVRVHHKPTKERGSDRNECEKLRFREQRRKQAQEQRLQRIRNMSAQEMAAAKEGLLLRHLNGLCLQPGNGLLKLADCGDFNVRLVEADAMEEGEVFLGEFVLKLGDQCAAPSAEMAEPQLLLAPCHRIHRHLQIFRVLRATGNSEMFILQHKASSKCIHPNEGNEKPEAETTLLLHHQCDRSRRALMFQAKDNMSAVET